MDAELAPGARHIRNGHQGMLVHYLAMGRG
jgi:hypothetical protein